MSHATHAAPRSFAAGAPAAQGAVAPPKTNRFRAALWNALAAIGRARAQPALLALARQYEATQPELARELRAVSRRALHG